MEKNSVQADLSGWLSSDEERLLNLYRKFSQKERSELVYRITRLHFAPWFAEHFDEKWDAKDPTYLHEELEQQLKIICPRHYLGEFLSEEPHCFEILNTAWGSIAPVILGSSEQDGQRADELFNTALRLWDSLGEGPHLRKAMQFKRADALALIETWREAVLELVFRGER